MNEDTIKLLKECNSGCKAATNSIEQVIPFIGNDKLKTLIDEFNDKHIKLGDEFHQLLNQYKEDEKDPPTMAKAFSWLSTEIKLTINDSAHEVADIMLDGCHYGIKSVSRYLNNYKAASEDSVRLANKLINMEKEFMEKLLTFV